ncbi:alpha/beta fold hydrolase [Actinoplanes sp. NPDC000266]
MTSTSDSAVVESGTYAFLVDDVRQVYHVHGQGPVMIAHSGGPGIAYGYLRAPELEKHFTMVYLEPVGSGASGRLSDPHGYTTSTYARFVAAVAEHLGVRRPFVLGHSHGGFVAQRYALDFPDRLAGLVLYDTSPTTGPEFDEDNAANVQAYLRRYPDQPEAAELPAAFSRLDAATDDVAYSTALRDSVPIYFADFWSRRSEYAPMQAGVKATLDPRRAPAQEFFDVRGKLGTIDVPTVILVGRYDFICSPRFAVMLHNEIKGSRLVVFERSGHFAHIEQPEEFAKAVCEAMLPG